jgi:hemoglobin
MLASVLLFLAIQTAAPAEEPVEPYAQNNANAGAVPFVGDGMARAFHGRPGIRRVVDGALSRYFTDPVTGAIFVGHDRVRLQRVLFEQFCYILNAGCTYTGRDMKSAHKDMGVQQADMNRLVELLQQSMHDERVGFAAQNKFLSKLAPMRRDVVTH